MPEHCLVSHQLVPAIRRLRPRTTFTFGRDLGCEAPLPSEHISRRHAELTWHLSGVFVIRDRGSKNGTRVNGVPVLTPQILKDGDTIDVGPFSFRFRAFEGSMADLLGSEIDGAETTGPESMRGLASAAGGPAPSSARLAFAGGFSDHDLLEVCRVIACGDRTGTLTVTGASIEGQISFDRGEIHRAKAGDLGGIEAAHAILLAASGRFEFAEGPIGLTPNCRVKAEPLIMEVAKRLDHTAPRVCVTPAVAQPGALGLERQEGVRIVDFDDTCSTVKMDRPRDGGAAMSAPLMDEAPLLDEAPPGA